MVVAVVLTNTRANLCVECKRGASLLNLLPDHLRPLGLRWAPLTRRPVSVLVPPLHQRLLSSCGTQLDYTAAENDPVGSVSIFKRQWKTKTYLPACEVGFDKFNTQERTERLVGRGMRVGGRDFTTFAMVSPPVQQDGFTGCALRTPGIPCITDRSDVTGLCRRMCAMKVTRALCARSTLPSQRGRLPPKTKDEAKKPKTRETTPGSSPA